MFIFENLSHKRPCSRPNGNFLWEIISKEPTLSAIKIPDKMQNTSISCRWSDFNWNQNDIKSDGWLIHFTKHELSLEMGKSNYSCMCAPFRPSVPVDYFSSPYFPLSSRCKFPAHHKFLSVKRMHEKNIHHRSVCRLTEWISPLFQRGIESFSLAAELSCALLQLLNFGNMGKLSRESKQGTILEIP